MSRADGSMGKAILSVLESMVERGVDPMAHTAEQIAKEARERGGLHRQPSIEHASYIRREFVKRMDMASAENGRADTANEARLLRERQLRDYLALVRDMKDVVSRCGSPDMAIELIGHMYGKGHNRQQQPEV